MSDEKDSIDSIVPEKETLVDNQESYQELSFEENENQLSLTDVDFEEKIIT